MQMGLSQGYLVDRTADQVGVSYARQSSSNLLDSFSIIGDHTFKFDPDLCLSQKKYQRAG